MSISITFRKSPKIKADTAIFLVYKGKRLSDEASRFDKENGGHISHCLKKQQKFTGAAGQLLGITAPKNSPYIRFVVIGLGDAAKLDAATCENAGGKLYLTLNGSGSQGAHCYGVIKDPGKTFFASQVLAHLAMGLKLRAYKFDKYKTKGCGDSDDQTSDLKKFECVGEGAAKAAKSYGAFDDIAAGVHFARNLVNEPPNMLYPDSFAKIIKKELVPLGVEVEIFDEKKMKRLGFEAALAVGMGSSRPPRIAVMRWKGGTAKGKAPVKSKNAPLAFVGKGVTFDTGGMNLKPSGGMEEMKLDMAGAAAVVGLMKTLARRKSKAHVVGIVGLAENMPSHTAYRPSDVIGSLSGKTIEVSNTDAEGRLVLADCLTYVQRTYKPRLVIDLATLTGAMMVALGHDYCGSFVNDDKMWGQLEEASKQSGEKLWRMPLDEVFKKDMVSKIADVQSLGNMGRYAGACTAAGFLEHFIEDNRSWAHLDIAGTAWIKADRPTCPKPSTGFGVRVLDRFIAENYE